MRELDRNPPALQTCAVVGAGRLGTALASALAEAGLNVEGPLGRGANPRGRDAVLLCVPDGEIANAAAAIAPGPLVGHCSGATGLDALTGHEGFGLHPLMTFPRNGQGRFAGAGCAIAGTTPRALAAARELAGRLGMRPFEIADEDRAAYHAAAAIASNFLVALEGAAERLAATAGVDRHLLAPLVRAAADDWAQRGAQNALTGPLVRGDERTVARQRAAIEQRTPELLGMFDAMVELTRELAGRTATPPLDSRRDGPAPLTPGAARTEPSQ